MEPYFIGRWANPGILFDHKWVMTGVVFADSEAAAMRFASKLTEQFHKRDIGECRTDAHTGEISIICYGGPQ